MTRNFTPKDPYQVITDRIIAALEAGTAPWRKAWAGDGNEPKNLISGREYRGFLNCMLLSVAGHDSLYWLTDKQAKDLGGNVRKGEHGTTVTYWNWIDRADEAGELKRLPFLKTYTVFNALAQCEGLDGKIPDTTPPRYEHDPIKAAEAIIAAMPNRPAINHGGGEACYMPGRDDVKMPMADRFQAREDYYSAMFHELAHSTGHKSRLDRGLSGAFGCHAYSKEELVAEMTAAYLCGQAGIVDITIANNASYKNAWLTALHNQRRIIVIASKQKKKAADYILDRTAKDEAALDQAA
jgi:antirestriction protein ArdC